MSVHTVQKEGMDDNLPLVSRPQLQLSTSQPYLSIGSSSLPAMTAQLSHSVIHIGGPSFLPPAYEHFTTASSASSTASSSSSPDLESRFSMSTTSSRGSMEDMDLAQAHLAYARQMASHTAAMWQRERLAIEQAKLNGTWTGSATSRTNGSAKPVDTPPKQQENRKSILGIEIRGRSRRRREF